MPKIVVTGATGQLGQLVVGALLDRGHPAEDVIAAVRTPENASDLAAQGVEVRHADYARPETLGPALEGADRVLPISGRTRHRIPARRDAAALAPDDGRGLGSAV